MMKEVFAAILMVIGGLFCLVSAVGMLRLPDTLMRMHAATKAGTVGTGLIVVAAAIFTNELGTTLKAIAVIVFLLLTAPVAAHLIGRAAYHRGIHLFDKTWIDELGGTMNNSKGERDDRDPHPTDPCQVVDDSRVKG